MIRRSAGLENVQICAGFFSEHAHSNYPNVKLVKRNVLVGNISHRLLFVLMPFRSSTVEHIHIYIYIKSLV